VKNLTSFTAALTLLLGISRVQAADSGWSIDAGRLGLLQRASRVLGTTVRGQHGKKLGVVSDFMLDVPTGQVVLTLVAGSHAAQLTPVPADLYCYTTGRGMVLNVEREQFAAAPGLPKINPLAAFDQSRWTATFGYFHRAESGSPPARPNAFASAVHLLGAPLLGSASEPLGEVKELMLDLQRNRIVYLVIAPAAASGETLYLVPPLAVVPAATGRELTLAMDRKQFLAAPHFQNEFWADLASPQLAAEVCAYFKLPTGAPPAAGNVEDRLDTRHKGPQAEL
jgi:sporulation protein YlmC with PRC-barrel domain